MTEHIAVDPNPHDSLIMQIEAGLIVLSRLSYQTGDELLIYLIMMAMVHVRQITQSSAGP